MKNKLLSALILFICLLFSNPSSAQYQSLFGSQSTSWKFSGVASFTNPDWPNGPQTFHYYYHDSVFVAGDSIIDLISYKNLQSTIYDNDGSIFSSGMPYGFVREDSVTGKAWYKLDGESFNPERLVYDISLSAGDSFMLPNLSNYIYVDSVYYNDGRKHIQFDHLSSVGQGISLQKLTFIEGIGTNYGLSYYINALHPTQGRVLLCSYKNQVQVHQQNYNAPGFTGCRYEHVVGIEENKQTRLLLTPNPASETVSISREDLSPFSDSRIQVLDMLGRIVQDQIVMSGQNQLHLNVANLKTGLYFVTLIYNSGEVWRQRLVVQK